MNYLLDTHVLLWTLSDPWRFSADTRHLLDAEENAIHVSIVSLWEIALKQRIGKLSIDFPRLLSAITLPTSRFKILDIALAHLMGIAQLAQAPGHNDPFDHLLIAQAITENMTMISVDARFHAYDRLTLLSHL